MQLQNLLLEFSEVISTGGGDLGRTSLTQHRINTGLLQPIKQPIRRLPFQWRQHVRGLLDDMLTQGIIAEGPWASADCVGVQEGWHNKVLCWLQKSHQNGCSTFAPD